MYGALGRYGFNGKEQDPDVKGSGAQYDYGFRIYDPRVGRFLSEDPLTVSFPFYTPYQFAGNKPINSIDLDGLEEKEVFYYEWTNSYGEKVVIKDEILLSAEQQRPEFGSKGTLYHYSFQPPNSYKTKEYDVYINKIEKNKSGAWNWIKGFFGKASTVVEFQLVIFGSGHADPKFGPKIDYSKPFETFNFNEFQEMFEVMLVATEPIPDKIDPDTFPDLLYRSGQAYLENLENRNGDEMWRDEREKHYYDPGPNKLPNYQYDITPNVYPMSNHNVGRTEIRTGPNGEVLDTLKYTSEKEKLEGKKSKIDTIPNIENNVKKF